MDVLDDTGPEPISALKYTIGYRIFFIMKVTALIPDDLIKDVKQLSGAKNITESLLIALGEWTTQQKLKALRQKVSHKPLRFQDGFTAEGIRRLNRN